MPVKKHPIVYFVRHGRTDANGMNVFRGTRDQLDDRGKQDAQDLVKWFDKKPISAVYSADTDRTKDTAEPLAMAKGLKVQPVGALAAIDVGYLAGEPKEEHEHVFDYFEKNLNERIPMGESFNQFRSRTQPPIKGILAQGAKSANPIVAVMHSSIIHELNHIITGDHDQVLVKPGGIVGVYHHPQQGLALKALYRPETKETVAYHG